MDTEADRLERAPPPPVAGAPDDWDCESARLQGKLHLFYYFRDRVLAFAAIDDES